MSCLGSRRRQSIAPWRFCCLVILAVASSSPGYCRSTADRFSNSRDTFSSPSSSSSSSSSPTSSLPRKTLGQEIGSPSELAWQAWLLVDNKNGGQSPLDSSNILRRITPKSIFIAPDLKACAKGFSDDGKGCKPDPIRIDENAQNQFLLMRLNAKFGSIRKKQPETAGPLQINIPFSLSSKASPPPEAPSINAQPQSPPQPRPHPQQHQTHKDEPEMQLGDRLTIPMVIAEELPAQSNDAKIEEAVEAITRIVYNASGEAKKEEQETTTTTVRNEYTSVLNENVNPTDSTRFGSKSGQVVPVAEIVEDTSETTSDVVDYKIPVSLRPAYNRSDSVDRVRTDESKETTLKQLYRPDLSKDSAPTVVLLSSTQAPFTEAASTPRETDTPKTDAFRTEVTSSEFFKTDRTSFESWNPSTIKLETEHDESTTVRSTESDVKYEADLIVQTVTPLSEQTPIESSDSTLKNTEKMYTDDGLEDETVYPESPVESESEDQEDYDDAMGDQYDSFGESEHELLKPGEAGMMLSQKNRDLLKKEKKHRPTTSTHTTEDLTSTSPMDTTTLPTFTLTTQDFIETSDSTIKAESTEYTKEDTTSTQSTETPSTIITTTEASTVETTTMPTKATGITNPTTIVTETSPTSTSALPSTSTIAQTETEYETTYSKEKLVTVPEVIFSTQESHGFTTAYDRRKPTTYPIPMDKTPHTLRELEEVIPGTEIPPFPEYHRRNSPINRRQKPSLTINDEPIIFPNDDIPFEFRDQMVESSKPLSMDFRRIPGHLGSDDFIRFPDQSEQRRSHQHQLPAFPRFPSDEVNSIHTQDYKEHLALSPYGSSAEYQGNSATSNSNNKSSVPARQKSSQSSWRLSAPPGLQIDRQPEHDLDAISPAGSSRQQKQKSMLMKFWARMPLVRESSLYSTTSYGSHSEPIGGHSRGEPAQSHRRRNSRFSSALSTMTPSSSSSSFSSSSSSSSFAARRTIDDFPRELFSRDVDRLLSQQFGRPVLGDA